MKHTPTPWKLALMGHAAGIFDADNRHIGSTWGSTRPENMVNARHIAKCVNLHDDLVAACEAVGTRHRIMYRAHEQTGTDERGYWIDAETMKAVQAALAKVEEAKT